MKAKTLLRKLGACGDSIDWVKAQSIEQAWNECECGEWMLWALEKLDVLNKRERVGIASEIAARTPLTDGRTVYDLMTDERSRKAIEVCRAYARGECDDADLEAAWAAAWGVRDAWAVAWAVAWAAASDAAQKWQADYVREHVAFERVEKKIKEVKI